MNTFEFFNRLLRPLSANSLESLGANEGLELVDALNASLQTFYRLAPDSYRRKTVSYYLPAPRVVEMDVMNGNKRIIAGLHTEDGQVIRTEDERILELDGVILVSGNHIGASIKIEGDPSWNRVDGENLLTNAYQGESGYRTATIYSDVIVLDGQSIERLANDPQLENGRVLTHDDMNRQYGVGDDIARQSDFYYDVSSQRIQGEPMRYHMGHLGDRTYGAVEAQGIVVLDPVPMLPYNVTFDAYYRPLRFTIDTLLRTPTVLPLADDLMESILLPIAIEKLTDSPLWRNEKAINRAERKASTAMQLISDLPSYIAVPNHQCGTPAGY